MMGPRQVEQGALFYEFSLDTHVPADHLLRSIDRFVDLTGLRQELAPFYASTGRLSVDPELMIRMLIIGYCLGIRSERRLCDEVHLNLAYRWFCRLGLDGRVPDHSTFSKNRHGRFRDSDLLRRLFETVLARCIAEGLVGGEGFAVDGSLIKADANRQKGVESSAGLPPEAVSRAAREYLAVLDEAAFGAATPVPPKFISPADPAARWTGAHGGQAFFAYWAIVRDEIAGCTLAQFEAMTGLSLTKEGGGLLDELPPISRFLNRVLALRIGVQNLLFQAFEERLVLVIEGAIAAGIHDVGLEVLTAESFTVTRREVAYTHPGSGAQTHLLTIAERRRLEPRSLVEALEHVEDGYRPLVNARTGRAARLGRAANETAEDGRVIERVRLVRPLARQIHPRTVFEASHWKEATVEAFRAAWTAELATLPEFSERSLHVVTGLLLPIWDRLPQDEMRVYRLVTDAGERIVGRVIDTASLHATRERLNLGPSPAMAPEEAWSAVRDGSASLHLSAGLQLRRVRVMGSNRVELTGAGEGARAELKALGLISEVIAWKTRLFIPVTPEAPAILGRGEDLTIGVFRRGRRSDSRLLLESRL